MKNKDAAVRNSGNSGKGSGSLQVSVHEMRGGAPLANAAISLYLADAEAAVQDDNWQPRNAPVAGPLLTDAAGQAHFAQVAPGLYVAAYENYPATKPQQVEIHGGCAARLCFEPRLAVSVTLAFESADGHSGRLHRAHEGGLVYATLDFDGKSIKDAYQVVPAPPWSAVADQPYEFMTRVRRIGRQSFNAELRLGRRYYAGGAAVAAPQPVVALEDSDAPPALMAVESPQPWASMQLREDFEADPRTPIPVSGNLGVSLSRTETEPTEDLPLWTLIRNSTDAMAFTNYQLFMDKLFCRDAAGPQGSHQHGLMKKYHQLRSQRLLPFSDADAYRVLKVATEAFVMVNCGVLNQRLAFDPEQDNAYLDRRDIPVGKPLADVLMDDYLVDVDGNGTLTLPYLAVIRRKLPDIPISIPHGALGQADLCFGIIQDKLTNPCLLELIWSYWHEEGMLVQSVNAITRRFQNVRAPGIGNDPLANTEIDPLRPLNNLLWGYAQDEINRLTVRRRNYEYDHHYGVRLEGRAVRNFRPADSRSKFLEAFHHLLRLLTTFYRQDDDTTVKADAFPVLNALKEVHLILSQGAHNQYGDLPSTARIEMLMQQWMLARPEFREFLPTRVMVAYPEPWMDRVDAMKKLQGWSDTSVMHFRNLAMFGEQLLLSVRYGNWSDIYEPTQAFNWARFWRPQVQGYIHAYRAATGVDLSIDATDPAGDATLPSILLRQRLSQQQRNA